MRWQLGGSLLLHAAVLSALIFLQPAAAPKPPGDAAIHVELVAAAPRLSKSEPTPDAVQKRRPPPLTAEKIIEAAKNHPAEKLEPTQTGETKPDPKALTIARALYSAHLLADRHNRSAREAMKTLAVDERIIQLCDIEAMEQVRRESAALKPDYVIAYAMADLKLSAHAVEAQGGAFLSHRHWYGLKFRCDVSPDDTKVVAFAFLVGQPIPKSEWASHNLTADASSAD